jgi:hypothetical protein
MFPARDVTIAYFDRNSFLARFLVSSMIFAAHFVPPYQYEWYLPARSLARADFALFERKFSDATRFSPDPLISSCFVSN